MTTFQDLRGTPCPSCGRLFDVAPDGFFPRHFQYFDDYKMLCSASETLVSRAQDTGETVQQHRSNEWWKPVFQPPTSPTVESGQHEIELTKTGETEHPKSDPDEKSVPPKTDRPSPTKINSLASKHHIVRTKSRERAPLVLTLRKSGKVKCPDCLQVVLPDVASQRLPQHGLGGNHVCRSSLRRVVRKENPQLRLDRKPEIASNTSDSHSSTKKKKRKPITLTPEEQKARDERIRQTLAKYRIRTPEELRSLRGEVDRTGKPGDSRKDKKPTKPKGTKRRRRRGKKKKGQPTEYIRIYYGGLPGSGKRR